jgi:hypothetical protein
MVNTLEVLYMIPDSLGRHAHVADFVPYNDAAQTSVAIVHFMNVCNSACK